MVKRKARESNRKSRKDHLRKRSKLILLRLLQTMSFKLILLILISNLNKIKESTTRLFQMTSITEKNTKAEIIAECVPLIEDQAERIQNLTEELRSALILLGATALIATIF